MHILTIEKCNNYHEQQIKQALTNLLAPFGGIAKIAWPGAKVLIKPNMLSCREPEKAATTHPALIKELALMCAEAGAEVFIGDSPPAIFGRTEEFWNRTGFSGAAKESGAKLICFETGEKQLLKFVSNSLDVAIPITQAYFDADSVVNLCKMKTHHLTRITGAIKNLYGLVPGLQKAHWHKIFARSKEFGTFIADFSHKLPCTMHIMDGIVGMDGQGPAGGSPYNAGLLFASDSSVAIDLAFCELAGISANSVSVLKRAKELNWGPASLEEVNYKGPPIDELKFKNFSVPGRSSTDIIPTAVMSLFQRLVRAYPVLKKGKCIKCGRCAKICPAKAIEMGSSLAEFDYSLCISCFCCLEVCPVDALEVKPSPLLAMAWKAKKLVSHLKVRTHKDFRHWLEDFSCKVQVTLLDQLAQRAYNMKHHNRMLLATALSWLAFDLIGIRRHEVISSLSKRLDMNESAARTLGRKVYKHFVLNAVEMAGLRFFSDEQLLERIKAEGLEHLDEALKRKHGAIIVSGHFGLWELVPPWLALQGYKPNVVVRRQNNPYVDEWMEEMRQMHGAETTDSGYGLRKILRSIKKGHILALMVDQDNGKQGIFVHFFNQPASAPTGPAQLSLKTGAPIVPLFLFPDYSVKHRLLVLPPIYPENFSNDVQGQLKITQQYTAALEQQIRAHPEQWFWLHRRWKTLPESAPGNPWAELYNSTLTKTPK